MNQYRKVCFVSFVGSLLAACAAPPLTKNVADYPIAASVELNTTRQALAACLQDENRKMAWPRFTLFPGVTTAVSNIRVSVLERPGEVTDVEFSFYEDVAGFEALYRLTGDNPTKMVLHSQWKRGDGGMGKPVKEAHFFWFDNCSKAFAGRG